MRDANLTGVQIPLPPHMNTLSQYQNKVNDIATEFNLQWSVYVEYIHLVEEMGELGEALTVQQKDRKPGNGKQALADHIDVKEELGDVLFTVLALSNLLQVNLTEVLDSTFKRYRGKLNERQI